MIITFAIVYLLLLPSYIYPILNFLLFFNYPLKRIHFYIKHHDRELYPATALRSAQGDEGQLFSGLPSLYLRLRYAQGDEGGRLV